MPMLYPAGCDPVTPVRPLNNRSHCFNVDGFSSAPDAPYGIGNLARFEVTCASGGAGDTVPRRYGCWRCRACRRYEARDPRENSATIPDGSPPDRRKYGLLANKSRLYLIEYKMMSDASDMLAAALEQMDGIIAGNHYMSAALFQVGMAYYGVRPHLETIELHAGKSPSSSW
ncbi:hypothetical protein EYF80_066951 [Liparis tanakae]|uniref:Uncharacterized protein n=1 Tax=Liparis tanakae TaxID=230148 RepID=A0A4Z2E2H3_9TELE|nr:hypothetical protein EYF80_066951 [Liparis tanakae]